MIKSRNTTTGFIQKNHHQKNLLQYYTYPLKSPGNLPKAAIYVASHLWFQTSLYQGSQHQPNSGQLSAAPIGSFQNWMYWVLLLVQFHLHHPVIECV